MTSDSPGTWSWLRRHSAVAGLLALFTGLPCIAQAAPADMQRMAHENGAFQAHARSEMEAALGAPIRTHQDAINAAYLSVGWTWGADTPDELDDAAYRKAWRWGFRIEEFARTRDARFSPEDLASAPLRPGDLTLLARASAPADAHVNAVDVEPERVALGSDRLASVEQRVVVAQQEIARITDEIDQLERRARGDGGSTAEQEARKAQLEALTRSLEESQATLASLQGELRDVTRELAAK